MCSPIVNLFLNILFVLYFQAHFVVDPKSRKQTIQSIGTKWRNFKHTLYRDYIETQKDDPEQKKSLLNPPLKYPFLKKEDWKLFVAQRTSKQWEETSKKAKKVRAHHKYNHHLSRKGYARLTTEIV
uniref:Transposase, Ptta/En/Spm, plant n=1 Tax=Helianthus annuus TaxID=4232 RepID=A0A251TY09_HELAN